MIRLRVRAMASVAALLATAACGTAESAGSSAITARDALVTAPAGDGPAAMYLTIANTGRHPDTLVAVATDAAGRSELHRQVHEGQLVRMEEVAEIEIPARGEVRLMPGGDHLMLLDPHPDLSPGDTIVVELTYRRAGTLGVPAVVGTHADAARMMEEAAGGDPRGGR